jgi:cysteine synthase A
MRKKIYNDISECIGKTPLIKLHFKGNMHAVIAAKLEFLNPSASIKDRMVSYILRDAQKRGFLKPGSIILESSYGNTGFALAALCAAFGYRLILTMPDSVSEVVRRIFDLYGAEIILTPASKGMRGALKKLNELKEKYPDGYLIHQFNNPANPEAYFKSLGVEIWEETKGKVEIVVAGIGTGGTITGVAKYLKKHKPEVKIFGVEPDSSPVLSKGIAGKHRIAGIGAGFIPQVYDKSCVDHIIRVTDQDALTAMKRVARETGILAGISSGAAAHAALQIADRYENNKKLIVTIFPDKGDKYYYTRFIQ